MQEIEPETGRDGLGTEHRLWLAMQAAHNRYKSASAALDALTALSPTGAATPERTLQIESAAAEQRSAFEDYIESRLQLSESMLSKMSPAHESPDLLNESDEMPGFRARISGAVVLAIAAAFLFPTAFGVGYLMHERSQIHNLEAARDEANAALDRTLNQVQELARRVQSMKTASAVTPHRPARKPPRIARNHDELMQLQRRGERTYREFTLTPSKHSEHIGAIGLEVLKVDPQRRYFDVSITVNDLPVTRKRLSLYQPVWIDTVELVVNRIGDDRVQGYVSEPKPPRVSFQRPSDSNMVSLP